MLHIYARIQKKPTRKGPIVAKDSTSITNGTDFITVQVEVSDNCMQATAAVKQGMRSAAHQLGHAMPKLMDLAEKLETDDGSVAMVQSKRIIDDVTCTVRIRGRIEGARPILTTELFDEIASTVNRKVVKTAVGNSNQAMRDLDKLMDKVMAKGHPSTLFTTVFGGADMDKSPGGFEDGLVGAGAGDFDSFRGFGSNS